MSILAVVVTYHPGIGLLSEVLRSVARQVDRVAIIDNGSANAAEISALGAALGAGVIANCDNRGIAAAQNQGVDLARRDGFSQVLLLDQDTILGPGVVADLSQQLISLEMEGHQVAAIGPAYHEVNSQRRTRAYRAKGLRVLRIPLHPDGGPQASDFIIASGSLIPLSVLGAVGPFNEALFIDLVDTDWCFRARMAGYTAFISPKAGVDHHLGAGTLRVGPIRIAVHVPLRNYYWVRNALWLARQSYTPTAWRLYFVSRSLAFLATYPIFADTRGLRLRLIGSGIRDGIRGRLGPRKQV
jgi:rhamnosyltransferase